MHKEEVISNVESLLNDFLADKQLEIYQIQYKKEGPDWKLRIFLDKTADSENEYVNIEECEAVNRYLGEKLDEADFIDRAYMLEVSSPGLDRELIKDSDYTRFAGRLVEVKLYEAINGNKMHEGVLVGKNNDVVTIEVDGENVDIPANKISKINLAIVF